MAWAKIIQGGMGVGVSGWPLARAVSRCGQLGVVSGTGIAVLLVRRLQNGDPGGHMRRALAHFPIPDVAGRILKHYFIDGGKSPLAPYAPSPMPQIEMGTPLAELTIAANFVEVYLAKEGHSGMVGINYLEKLQTPTLLSLYGAMLADVDYVLMGAGIPRSIPGALDALSQGKPFDLRVDVEGAHASEKFNSHFDPETFWGCEVPPLRRPQFLAIVSSATLAMTLARKSNGRVDGFIIEGSIAGGHNAPPRGNLQLNPRGEPIYGDRDVADLEKIRELNLPFWLAGGFAHPEKLTEAIAEGAVGIQVGTVFAFCEESSISDELKSRVIEKIRLGCIDVFTDPQASPTGFPFKVLRMEGTLSDPRLASERPRICDLGYLRHVYRKEDGSAGYRCPAEPVDQFLLKGGAKSQTDGRICICNALFATVGLGQTHAQGWSEPPIITAGDDVKCISRFVPPGKDSYSAAEVIEYLLSNQTNRSARLIKDESPVPQPLLPLP